MKAPNARHSLIALPDNVPAGTRCIKLYVPDDVQYIQELAGMLRKLTYWTSYERDPTHKAKDVAQAWFDALQLTNFDTCSDCGASGGDDMQWRQNPDNCNEYQYSVDCVNWVTIFDIEQCVADAIARQTGQQTGGGQPPIGDCKTWVYNLPGNGQQILGAVVTEGDTITITGPTGGCGDGTGDWFCPAGTPYLLNDCGSYLTYSGADPLPTAPHMSIIGRIGTTSPVYIAPVAGVFTIPSGHFNEQFILMVNDSNLADNAGSYQFSAEYCAVGTAQWCYKIDFAVSDGGFVPHTVYSGTPGDYVALSGWSNADFQSPAANYYRGVLIDLSGFTADLTSIVVTYDRVDGGHNTGDSSTALALSNQAVQLYGKTFIQAQSGTDLTMAWTNPTPVTTTFLQIAAFSSYLGTANFYGSILIKSVEFHGIGTNPFGTDNC